MLDLIYKDNDLIVCIKPSGVLSTDEPGGMPDLITNQYTNINYVYTVHRLDRVVSGLMVYALNKTAASNLSTQIANKSFHKQYLAVIHGHIEEKIGRFDDLLFRDSSKNMTYVVKRMRKGVKDASLEYEVVSEIGDYSLVRVNLLTGRTHQIRAQFSSRGYVLLGDKKYGAAGDNCSIALWSYSLNFEHPSKKSNLNFCELPPNIFPWNLFNEYYSERKFSYVNDKHCKYSDDCGGCIYIQENYKKQMDIKQDLLNKTLGKFCKVQPIIPMEFPYNYRNKVVSTFGVDKKGNTISGIYKKNTHKLVEVDNCLLEDRTASEIINTIKNICIKIGITPYNEKSCSGFLRHVMIRRSESTGQIMVILVVADKIFKKQKIFLEELLSAHHEITTILLNYNYSFTPVVLGKEYKIIYGKGYIEDKLLGNIFRISPGAFYQVNNKLTSTLYKTAIQFAELNENENILDAYCGTGTIGLCCSKYVSSVIGVEINESAVKDAIYNARVNGCHNCKYICADTTKFFAALDKKINIDTVFLDPPRVGCSKEFLNMLIKKQPNKIIYISCNPITLAEDLNILKSNYKVQMIQGVDMFPFTEHVETVCLLSKLSNAKNSIDVKLNMDELDVTSAETKATYEEIKAYVMEHSGLQVSSLYIAQVKREFGIIERENYNKAKLEESRQPQCPEEKKKAIREALIHFGMI